MFVDSKHILLLEKKTRTSGCWKLNWMVIKIGFVTLHGRLLKHMDVTLLLRVDWRVKFGMTYFMMLFYRMDEL